MSPTLQPSFFQSPLQEQADTNNLCDLRLDEFRSRAGVRAVAEMRGQYDGLALTDLISIGAEGNDVFGGDIVDWFVLVRVAEYNLFEERCVSWGGL